MTEMLESVRRFLQSMGLLLHKRRGKAFCCLGVKSKNLSRCGNPLVFAIRDPIPLTNGLDTIPDSRTVWDTLAKGSEVRRLM